MSAIFAAEAVGVLEREVTVSMVEISRAGCLFESSKAIPEDTVAMLSVEIDGTRYREDVRVVRCLAVPGAGERHHIGVEFLSLRRPGPDSLRVYAASLRDTFLRVSGPSATF